MSMFENLLTNKPPYTLTADVRSPQQADIEAQRASNANQLAAQYA